MTGAELRQATGLGPEWHLIWAGADPVAAGDHLCGGLAGRLSPGRSQWVRLRYAPTATPGIEAAQCDQCRTAWVRSTPKCGT
ncbi:MAG TPA: hypothetical protein VED18_01310 [Candidatus Sulfotelmatobacter sp.]|nr:hypothetical protein [Candidatus Sulfotelmatobacter sp.]